MINPSRILIPLLIAGLLSSSAAAQGPNQNYQEETKAPGRAQASQGQAATAEEAARLDAAEADMSITYDQILANPDDIELNYRYARAQIARGELKSAAATLERVLLVKPDLAKVRLLYAVVLLRLDNLVEAQQELETLQALPMPDSLRDEINQYLAMIKKSRKRTKLYGTLAFGFENDDNRNSTPSTDQMLFGGTPVTLTGTTAMRHDDTAMLFMGGASIDHDLGYQAGHNVFAGYNYYRAEQTTVKTLNLQAHSVMGGFTYKTPWVNVSPRGYFDHILLAQTTFLREWGAGAHFDHQLNRRLTLYMDFKDLEQQYQVTPQVTTGPQRDGADINFTWGADIVLNAKMSLDVNTGYEIKNANVEFYSYTRNSLSLTHQWLLPRGTFFLTNLWYARDVYDQPQAAISSKYRRDDWLKASGTFGAPLSLIHRSLKDFLWTVNYEYLQTFSSLINYSYTNNKVVTMLTYRWDAAF